MMEVNAPGPRVCLLAAAWLALAAPAMLAAGLLLLLGREVPALVSRDMGAWGVPLVVARAVGLVVRCGVARRVAQTTQKALDVVDAATGAV